MTITAPPLTGIPASTGIYEGMDEALYHSGGGFDEPSLSVSGAKRLVKTSPAQWKYEQENRVEKKVWDFGHAAHTKVLGIGMEAVAIPEDLLAKNGAASTAAAKEWIDATRAEGKVPLKAAELAVVDAMALAIEANADAMELLATGTPETSMFWRDDETKVLLRGRADWRTVWRDVPVLVDYKTCEDPNPAEFRWDAGKFGYFQQDPWYREGIDLLTGLPHGFLFIAQAKAAPYLVSVIELDDDARAIGEHNNRVARRIYTECMTTGRWPAYEGITRVSVPNARPAKEYSNV